MATGQNNGGNPFYAVKIGSTVHESDGSFSGTVFQPGITAFASGSEGQIRMSGNSSFMYSDSMNQGSFGVSGSYGVKGISQYSTAVSAYVGNANAQNSRSTSLSIELMTWEGIEYIDFNQLTVSDLVAGISGNPSAYLTTALEKFNEMRRVLETGDSADQAISDWIVACEQFTEVAGTGVVVGVLWGGYGAVNLNFTSAGKEDQWQYGGDAQFTYAGTGASVAVSAAYGGSNSSIAETASAEVDAFYSGKNVKVEITAWAKEFRAIATKGLSELGKQKITRNADLSGGSEAPSIPDFVKPKQKNSKVTDLIKEIKDLDGLSAYATAAAFEKYKANGGESDLDTFIKERAEANDIGGLAREPIAPNLDLPHSHAPLTTQDSLLNVGDEDSNASDLKLKTKLAASPDQEFVPIGIWISSWSKLFPWLVSGHDNRIPKNAAATDTIRLRTFIQDCRSLEQIYHRVFTSGSTMPGIDFGALRDAFGHTAQNGTDLMKKLNKPDLKVDLNKELQRLIGNMSRATHTIYKVWAGNPVLRSYQLGGGLYAFDSSAEKQSIGALKDIVHPGASDPKSYSYMDFQPTAFEVDKKPLNTEAFSQFIKGRPIILPSGTIVLFLTDGIKESSGFLCRGHQDKVGRNSFDVVLRKSKQYSDSIHFGLGRPVKFEVTSIGLKAFGLPPDHNRTGAKPIQGWYYLIPIPFSAANGIDWKFGAATTGMGNLQEQLDRLREDLKARPQWSLDSDHWEGTTWSEHIYSTRTIKPSYIGIVDEVKNIFGSG